MIEDPKKIEKKMKEFDRRREMGEGGFIETGESPLDPHYFDLIQGHADTKNVTYILNNASITRTHDAFAPNREIEKKVKKLSLTN